ncbi:MAG: hypothetical protein GVY23_09690 [Spirochaetes bacterium]|jgi:hypothetical protein|nr:hypothetical protein [Spirochaetota bacterium]
MMRKMIVATTAAVALLLLAPAVFAQETVTDIFGIEVGTVMGYNFNTEDIGAGESMAVSFGFGEQFEASLMFIDGDGTDMPDFSLLRMSYYLLDEVGLEISTGSSAGAVAAGFGVFSYPIRREFNETLTTALGLDLSYLVPDIATDPDEGIIAFGLNATVAF